MERAIGDKNFLQHKLQRVVLFLAREGLLDPPKACQLQVPEMSRVCCRHVDSPRIAYLIQSESAELTRRRDAPGDVTSHQRTRDVDCVRKATNLYLEVCFTVVQITLWCWAGILGWDAPRMRHVSRVVGGCCVNSVMFG